MNGHTSSHSCSPRPPDRGGRPSSSRAKPWRRRAPGPRFSDLIDVITPAEDLPFVALAVLMPALAAGVYVRYVETSGTINDRRGIDMNQCADKR